MKKFLIFLLILTLLLGGLFLWKGGHHAIILADRLEDWLDADHADQTLTLQITSPGFHVEENRDTLMPHVRQYSFHADTFWTEYGDSRILGLSVGDYSAYLHGRNLYMDTGKAYSLEIPGVSSGQLSRLLSGLLLYGRITKTNQTYHLTMDTETLSLSASIVLDPGISSITLGFSGEYMGNPLHLHASLVPKQTTSHHIPQAVRDAIVHAAMEPPMPLTEPLEILIPALEQLGTFSADTRLRVSCGILNLSETVALHIADGKAVLTRDDIHFDITLPEELSAISPASMVLLILRSGEFSREGDDASFSISLPGDVSARIAEALIPQAANLGIRFSESHALLSIRGRTLSSISLDAEGTVPFLVTEIPVSFCAEFDIQ